MMCRIAVVFLAIAMIGCNSTPEGNAPAWFDAAVLEDVRKEKDDAFRESNDSPIPSEGRVAFGGLRYFPVNSGYAVTATFRAEASADTVMLATTHGDDVRRAVRAGTLQFSLNGGQHSLTVYQFLPIAANNYFVAFLDSTSGVETYHGGRYLEVSSLRETSEAHLDFNMAYNPYCAYNGDYSCPLVPPENRLAVSVRAGERSWK